MNVFLSIPNLPVCLFVRHHKCKLDIFILVEYFVVFLSKNYAEWDCVSDSGETFLCGVECYKISESCLQ